MKRTAEIVLSIIGIVINFIMIGLASVLAVTFQDNTLREDIKRELENDPNMQAANVDIDTVMGFLGGIGWGFVTIVLVSTILAIIAAFALRKNRKPKLAGGLLIAASLIVGIGTFLIGWLPGVLFLIAGILAFARRSKQTIEY
jgi:MFS family permease